MSALGTNIDIADVLQIAVFERVRPDTFLLRSKLPDWWNDDICIRVPVMPTGNSDVTASECFQFTHDVFQLFVEDADVLWSSAHVSPISSLPIDIETRDPLKRRVILQGLAVSYEGRSLLLIRNLATFDRWLTDVLQRARKSMLSGEQQHLHAQRQLEKVSAARDEAIQREKAGSDLLAHTSHEIRNPLTTILGFAAKIEESATLGEHGRYLESIRDAASHLLHLSSDILDFSKISENQMSLQPKIFDISNMLKHLQLEWETKAHAKDLSLRISLPESLPQFVLGDEVRLRQVLGNLFTNALKFTVQGEIGLILTRSGDDRFEFGVQDTGPGIPADQLETIFESFQQVAGPQSHLGVGLGLSIAARLVELMGGQLRVNSELGTGSCFHFECHLPAAASGPEKVLGEVAFSAPISNRSAIAKSSKDRDQIATERPDQSPIRLLVAEDHQVNRALICDALKSQGWQVIEVADGRAALEAWRRHDFDALLMDCHMPHLGGDEVISQIRASDEPVRKTSVPIIALTADAQDTQRNRLLQLGANAHVAKPFTRKGLVDAVRQAIEAASRSGSFNSEQTGSFQ